ncbi:AEC family transporter [Pantoea sp. 1.19]|uniref:AEC family transporter n=1 Tax=Pantoea sp. 1.19 TaxID=1925589 RepID=UPI000948CBA6|nr:AEC family transporter [Pantoea sp. 1.19]
MTYVIIQALAPIFLIMALGYFAGKTGMVDNQNVALLNIFVMDFALPATLFSATVQTPWAGILQQSPLAVVLVLAMWLTWALVWLVAIRVYHQPPQVAAVLTLTVALPNYAALGLPILASVLGDAPGTSLSVAVSIACGSVLMTPLCLLILEREKARAAGESLGSQLAMLPRLMYRSVKKSIVWAPLLGVVLSALGVQMPALGLAALKPLGLAATGGALFLTGVILSARRLRISVPVLGASAVKLLIQPLIAWGLVWLLGLQGALAIASILMSALAAGFFGVVFGNRFGVQSPDAEATLLLSSVLSIVTLPLFIGFTAGL